MLRNLLMTSGHIIVLCSMRWEIVIEPNLETVEVVCFVRAADSPFLLGRQQLTCCPKLDRRFEHQFTRW